MVSFEEINIAIRANANLTAFQQVRKELSRIKQENMQINRVTNQMQRSMSGFADVTKKEVAGAFRSVQRESNRFKGELLSMMFFGMAITRVFGGFLRSSFQSFQKTTEGTNMANNALTRLTASWEFLKFSLINALLDNPFFAYLIESSIRLVDRFNNLNDSTKGWFGAIVGVTVAVGGLMTAVGLVGLGIEGVIKSFALLGTVATAAIAKINTALVWLAANPIVLLISSLLAIIVVLFMLRQKFGSFGNALKAWAGAIGLAILLVFQSILSGVEFVIDALLVLIANVLAAASRAARALGFTKLAGQLSSFAGTLSGIIEKKIDIVSPGAAFLDRIGLNPSSSGDSTPTTVVQNNEFNIGGGTSGTNSTAELVDEIIRRQNEEAQRLGLSI